MPRVKAWSLFRKTDLDYITWRHMLEVKVSDLYEAKDVLSRLAAMDFSIRTSYLLAKIIKAVNTELIECETKKRALVIKYGVQDEHNGNIWHTKPEHKEEVHRQLSELFNTPVQLLCSTIKLSILSNERIYSSDQFLPVLLEVKEGKRSPESAVKELQGKALSLTPIEIAKIEKFIEHD